MSDPAEPVLTMTQLKKRRKELRNAANANDPKAERKARAGRDGKPIRLENAGDEKLVVLFDTNAGAFEKLVFSDLLNDFMPDKTTDDERKKAHEWGEVRRHTMQMLRDLQSRAAAGPLKSVDWGRVGSSGFGPRSLSASQYEALVTYGDIMTAMPKDGRSILEQVLINDLMVWKVPSRIAKGRILEDIRLAVDFAAYHVRSRMHKDIDKCVGPKRMEVRWPDAWKWLQSRPVSSDKDSARRRDVRTSSGRV